MNERSTGYADVLRNLSGGMDKRAWGPGQGGLIGPLAVGTSAGAATYLLARLLKADNPVHLGVRVGVLAGHAAGQSETVGEYADRALKALGLPGRPDREETEPGSGDRASELQNG